jgi:calcineurin-like phosphoesterase
MTFEEKIINNASIRQKKLMRPAKIAQQKPDTGVSIVKKGAYFLIKDCADVTVKFLAHLAYSSYKAPIKDLNGKFTQAEVIDFVGRSKVEPETKQLLHIILTDIGTAQYKAALGDSEAEPIHGVTTNVAQDHDYTITDGEDVYGDYSLDDIEDAPQPVNIEAKEDVNVDDVTAVINKLIEIFDAK